MTDLTTTLARIIQINTGRRRLASSELINYLVDNNILAAAIQEPYIYQGTICNTSNYKVACCSSDGGPRAAILVAPNLNLIFLAQHSTRDIAVCSLNLGIDTLYLVSIYLPPSRDANGQEVRIDTHLDKLSEIVRWCTGHLLICGDFNGHHINWGSIRSNQRGREIVDFVAANDLHLLNDGSTLTFFVARNDQVQSSNIDLTLASTRLIPRVSNWRVIDDVTLSDHRLIEITLTLGINKELPRGTRLYRTTNVDWTNFKEIIAQYYEPWKSLMDSIRTKVDLNNFTTKWINDISTVCQHTLSIVKLRKKCVPWWTSELTALRGRARRWKRKVCRVASLALREVYLPIWLNHLKTYKMAISKAKTSSWRNFVSNQGREDAWAKVYRICKNPKLKPPTTIRKVDGTFTVDPSSSASYQLDAFLPDNEPANDTSSQENIRRLAQCSCNEPAFIAAPFTHEEIEDQIMTQNDKKSPGKDGITANILKTIFQVTPDTIQQLYNLCLQLGCFPKAFKHSVVRTIPKHSTSDHSSIKSWRPISLLPIPGKVLERLMITRVRHDLTSRGLLSDKQFGFKPHRSTTDAIMRVTSRIRSAHQAKQTAVVISLDVSGAFDNAWWPMILYRLKYLAIPHELWHLCSDYFKDRTAELLNSKWVELWPSSKLPEDVHKAQLVGLIFGIFSTMMSYDWSYL